MKYVSFLIGLVLPAAVCAADRPISPEEFERMVTGKTFSYANRGVAYGAEAYLGNRRVQWSFLDGECTEGHWYVVQEQVCFVYEDIPNPQCWQFFLDGQDKLTAKFQNDPLATEVYETERQDEPLYCKGPDVGA